MHLPRPLPNSRLRSLLAAATSLLLVVFAFGAASSSQAAPGSALPICVPGDYSAEDWFGVPSGAGNSSVVTGQTGFAESYWVKRGLVHGCASQQRQLSNFECTTTSTGKSCMWVHDRFVPSGVNSLPQVIDAAGGDEQAVTVTFANAREVLWGQCLPRTGLGTVTCPDDADNPGYSGTVLFRFADATGEFSGRWQVSQTGKYSGFVSPGFMLQAEHGACERTATSCRYLVRFTRDTLNQPAILKDVQLLLQFNFVFTNDHGERAENTVAVPLLVQQRGGPAITPDTPDPSDPSVPTSETTPGGSPGPGSGAGGAPVASPGPVAPLSGGAFPGFGPSGGAGAPTGAVKLRRSSVKIRKNRASLPLECEDASCEGKLTLRTSSKSKKSLGSKSFKITAGKRSTIKLKLNRRGRALMRKHKRKKLELTVAFKDGSTQTLTITLRR